MSTRSAAAPSGSTLWVRPHSTGSGSISKPKARYSRPWSTHIEHISAVPQKSSQSVNGLRPVRFLKTRLMNSRSDSGACTAIW